jgi:hypothetical protein
MGAVEALYELLIYWRKCGLFPTKRHKAAWRGFRNYCLNEQPTVWCDTLRVPQNIVGARDMAVLAEELN